MDADGFEFVTHKKRNKRGKNSGKLTDKNLQQHQAPPPDPIDPDKFAKKFEDSCSELKESKYFKNLLEKFESVDDGKKTGFQELVCLGIGNFSDSIQARFQLALLHNLAGNLNVDRDRVTIFDPHLTESEVDFAASFLGYVGTSRSLKDNCEGRYKATARTLVFMPHCPKQLTNNLLYANWTPQQLRHLVIFCNSFDRLAISQPERILREQGATLILKVAPICKEIPVENDFRLTDVFNDLSVHSFAPEKVEPDSDFWSDVNEPEYPLKDLEFVQKTESQQQK